MLRLLTLEEFEPLERTAEELIFSGKRADHSEALKAFKFKVRILAAELPPYPANVLKEMAQYVSEACGNVR